MTGLSLNVTRMRGLVTAITGGYLRNREVNGDQHLLGLLVIL